MPLILRVKPKNIEKTDTGEVNHGGRDLTADESPTGKPIKAGSTFTAPLKWYEPRSHWKFLVVVDKEPAVGAFADEEPVERLAKVATEVENKSGRTAEEWNAIEWNDFRGIVRDLGLSSGGSRDAIMDRLEEAGYVRKG